MPARCAIGGREAKTLPQAKEHRPRLGRRRPAQPTMLSESTVSQAGKLDPVPVFREIQTLTAQAGRGNPASSPGANPRRKDWGEVWGPRPRPPRPPHSEPQGQAKGPGGEPRAGCAVRPQAEGADLGRPPGPRPLARPPGSAPPRLTHFGLHQLRRHLGHQRPPRREPPAVASRDRTPLGDGAAAAAN